MISFVAIPFQLPFHRFLSFKSIVAPLPQPLSRLAISVTFSILVIRYKKEWKFFNLILIVSLSLHLINRCLVSKCISITCIECYSRTQEGLHIVGELWIFHFSCMFLTVSQTLSNFLPFLHVLHTSSESAGQGVSDHNKTQTSL